MTENVVLIGAGSAMFTRGLLADMINRKWEGQVRLVDTNPDALAVAEGLAGKMIRAARSPMTVAASVSRRDVLDGATAVICTIGVGGRRAWEKDVFIPREYGIYQPVGDTVMPGGASRALRMIPAMVDIAEDVMDLAGDALFFNYGNPMAAVCRGVRKATNAQMVGLCHGVTEVADHLARLLGVERDKLTYTAVGMNHLTWFTEVRIDGRDAMPRLRALAEEKLARLAESNQQDGHPAEPQADVENPFTWELLELFGAFPAVLDRHVTEFFPHMFGRRGAYYGKTLGVDAFSFEATIKHGDEAFEQMRTAALSPESFPEEYFDRIGGEHEQVTEIIESIRSGAGRHYSANVPNAGQIPNLPAGAIVECPCATDGGGLRPLAQEPMDPALAGTLATRFQWVETVVEAALRGSARKFAQALLIDGAVDSVSTARALAEDLIEAHAEHLPRFSRPAGRGKM